MPAPSLIVCDGPLPESIRVSADAKVLSHAEFAAGARNGTWFKRILAYGDVGMVVPHTWLRSKPLLVLTVMRMLSRGACWLEDEAGNKTQIGIGVILRRALTLSVESCKLPFLLRDIRKQVDELQRWSESRTPSPLHDGGVPLYLRTDLWFTAQVGGSVTHTAGVVNHLQEFFGRPQVFLTAPNPLLSADLAWKRILPEARYWDFREIPALAFSATARQEILKQLRGAKPSFIYQRYSLNNYAGAMLARDLAVPLVLEYNGSEVWISQNWGKAAARADLSAQIEALNLSAADLIVVVSKVLRDELVSRAVDERKILINPNGVDIDFFRPDVDAAGLRASLGLDGKTVIGFIGTFGPWHGAQVLVQAFASLLSKEAANQGKLHLLMVGDGAGHPAAQKLAQDLGVADSCSFTGLVPQLDGPRYLACCDILAAPHVPNADGTEFFGSPTKLFEYMAMGRPILASRLGQIGEVLEHDRSGWLVEAGSPESLSAGLSAVLANVELRARLGAEARDRAVKEYSWRTHVEKLAAAIRKIGT
ncbi:hypothetical protein BH11PSE11_BH11PSE11_38320 [soil metagenome]